MFEKPYFSCQTPAISDEIPIGSDHTMAGDDDDDGIFIIRSSDRTHGFRISCEDGFFLITSGFSIWDLRESFPSFLLKYRSSWWEWDGESFSFSYEVFFEFFFCLIDDRIRSILYHIKWSELFLKLLRVTKFKQKKMIFICYSNKISEGRWNRFLIESHRCISVYIFLISSKNVYC